MPEIGNECKNIKQVAGQHAVHATYICHMHNNLKRSVENKVPIKVKMRRNFPSNTYVMAGTKAHRVKMLAL